MFKPVEPTSSSELETNLTVLHGRKSPPITIKKKIPTFKIGYYKDIHEMELSSSDDDDEDMDEDEEDDEEELKRIQSDLQNKTSDKCDRTPDSSDQDQKKKVSKHRSTPYPKGKEPSDSSDLPTESSDDELPHVPQPSTPKTNRLVHRSGNSREQQENNLNKTLVPETPQSWNDQVEAKDQSEAVHEVLETPMRIKSTSSHDFHGYNLDQS